MARPLAETVRALSDERLREEEESTERELLGLRFQASTRQLGDPTELRKARRKLAQIKTVIRERGLAAAAQEQS